MAPRATWKGTLNLAQMSCAVKLYAATTDSGRISFNQLHKTTHRRISMKPVDAVLGVVEREDLVKGYEFEPDRYVIIDDTDLVALKPDQTHCIEIDSFTAVNSIPDTYLDTSYYLVPDGAATEAAYHLMREVLQRTAKVAIARVVLASRERVMAIRSIKDGLLANILLSPAEVRGPAEYFEGIGPAAFDAKLVALAEKLVAQKTKTFDPITCEDRYELALHQVIEEKLHAGVHIVASPAENNMVSLTTGLKASLNKRIAASSARVIGTT